MSVRLIVADDDPMALELMGLILARDNRFTLAAVAKDGTEAIAAVLEHQPDLLLLDVHMPGEPTSSVIESVRGTAPSTRVLLLSAVHVDQAMELCDRFGADGFVPKGLSSGDLLDHLARTATV
jgi:DNA-binding NarL/FixJ family response regulator